MEILRELPQYVSSIVVEYMMPNELGSCEKITFHKLRRDAGSDLDETNYSPKYELAYDEIGHSLEKRFSRTEDGEVTTDLHLSRVWKKNGRHRYYLTFHEDRQNVVIGDKGSMFTSRYIGNNLEEAIVTFLLFPETKCKCNKCIIKRVEARDNNVWKEYSHLGKPYWNNVVTGVSEWENPALWDEDYFWNDYWNKHRERHNLDWKTLRVTRRHV
jgi:hypothetical protein